MLNWLKKKTRISFQSRYINILRRHNQSEMFLTEQTMFNPHENETQPLKLFVYNENGDEYCLDVPHDMTLDKIMMMSAAHFYNPLEAVGGEPSSDGTTAFRESYRLVLVRTMNTLDSEQTVTAEELISGDELLLVKCRKQSQQSQVMSFLIKVKGSSEKFSVTKEQIYSETNKVEPKNMDRDANPVNTSLDFKIAFRRILLTMIEASVHLIAPEDNSADMFVLVFEHLEKRHKPRVDKGSLKQLTDMGFSEARAIKALQLKRNVVEATDWLLEESKRRHSGCEEDSDILLLTSEERKLYFVSDKDPAKKVMQEFNKYVEKWFVPDSRALQNLMHMGYGEDLAKEALRESCNNESIAKDFLDGNDKLREVTTKGFDKDSVIMSAILNSTVVQVALSKPKTLFALMVLCETPNNINVWLSDPETHPVVSQILRIYHAEKHRLCHESPELTSEESYCAVSVDDDLPMDSVTSSECRIVNIPSMPRLSGFQVFFGKNLEL